MAPQGGHEREAARGAWRALHAALMPDYNRKATLYWWAVVALGMAVLAHAATVVAGMPMATWGIVGAGTLMAMAAGFFPVRIPRSKNSFAAGEIFVFMVLLIGGPAAATLAAAGETAVGAWRSSKRWTSRIVSPAISAMAMFAAGSALHLSLGKLKAIGLGNDGLLVAATMTFSIVYFVFNSLLASGLLLLKRNERFSWALLVGVFGFIGFAFAGSAAVAALLYLAYRQSGVGVLLAVVPLLGMLLATLHYYNRQQEAHEAARQAAAQAAEREAIAAAQAAQREAQLASRHLQELEASERRFHSAFTHASIGMALLTFDGKVLQANAALHELLGESAEGPSMAPVGPKALTAASGISERGERGGLLQRDLSDLVCTADHDLVQQQLTRVQERAVERFELELRCRHRDGGEVWVALHCSHFTEPGAAAPRLILQVQDISARRKAEQNLHDLAFTDTLTGLPNRRCFQDELAQAVATAKADPSQRFAVLYLDFDRFKLINDSLGHGAGDEFLVLVTQRVQQRLRPHDVVARLGGDEFAILMRCYQHDDAVLRLADRLLQTLAEPYTLANAEMSSSASIGITTSAIGYVDAEAVLRDADIAMYRAKAAGKARWALFDVSLHAQVSQRLRLEGALRQAIEEGSLEVAYQPLMRLEDNRITGFEALARWTHPEHGTIGPDVFIPIAEESGLIVPLTDLVLRRACRQLHAWQGLDASLAGLIVHVNLSSKDLAHQNLFERVTHALAGAGLEPRHLALELTENILMERIETALPMLAALRGLGVQLSVDDFGTGYSSLAHLSSLPIDNLKIDRCFVRNLRPGTKESMVVRGIVQLGNSLGKRVVAEGIETAAQLDQLREMGCHSGQGFHFSKPLPAQQAQALLERVLDSRRPRVTTPDGPVVGKAEGRSGVAAAVQPTSFSLLH
jgi:diguanylate cyclase (GGDEF)-like protein